MEVMDGARKGCSQHKIQAIEGRREETLVQFRQVESHAVPEIGQGVAIAARDFSDQPLRPQFPQLTADARGAS